MFCGDKKYKNIKNKINFQNKNIKTNKTAGASFLKF